jgi:DNA invertase Pin-like site-specific DNA recombinase
MSRRRLRHRSAKAQRHAQPPLARGEGRVVVREASYVERLAYSRSQAAQALGISRSTVRRLLPYVETIEMPWGGKLIPVEELERLIAERRRAARARAVPRAPGRPPAVTAEVAERIRAARTRGQSFRQIAAELNADETPTAHGGVQWWPSTVRAVLRRAA